jgi:hypothetical protein
MFLFIGMKYMVTELMYTALKAWYEDGKICLLLSDGKEIRFPVTLNRQLKSATTESASNIKIICNGTGLHWPDLDLDLSILGIIEGRY